MSKGSTPIHTGSPYDSFYDPDYTAEISAKMHVPDKIYIVEGLQNATQMPNIKEEVRNMMNVPERILVAGENKHIAVRDYVPELKFEKIFPPTALPNQALDPPPNVLTIDEYPYPSVEFQKPATKSAKRSAHEQSLTIDLNESSISSVAPEDEIVMLRKQLRHLSRRVVALEQESQQRQQREMILYTVGITYFVCKGVIWLYRHF